MGCPSKVELGNNLKFSVCAHNPTTALLTDADSAPTYRIYENEDASPVLTGTMAKLDDDNTTGFYTELINCTTGNGFEAEKIYTIYIEVTVAGVKGGISYEFIVEDDLTTLRDIAEGDHEFDTGQTPWQHVVKKKGTSTELIRKDAFDAEGGNITDTTTAIGQLKEPS